jgi:hypothetical protein
MASHPRRVKSSLSIQSHPGELAAVDRDRDPVDERGRVGEQPGCDLCDLPRGAEALEWHQLRDLRLHVRGCRADAPGVTMGPGATALTLIPFGP